jgi:DNA-directed RNA polymerase specialized sigma24 family protein
MTAHAGPIRADPPVTDLVARARNGEKRAWDALVERYAPLVWSICRRHRLAGADADDIGQNVWLRLVGQLDTIRDPAALAGWLATTTQRECWRVLRAARRPQVAGYGLDAGNVADGRSGMADDELQGLLANRPAMDVPASSDDCPRRSRSGLLSPSGRFGAVQAVGVGDLDSVRGGGSPGRYLGRAAGLRRHFDEVMVALFWARPVAGPGAGWWPAWRPVRCGRRGGWAAARLGRVRRRSQLPRRPRRTRPRRAGRR